MRYLYFLYLKMRYLRFFGLLGICLAICLFSPASAHAQRVTFGIGVGGPAYYGPAPVCAYGYYDYYPYACAPYGYYGADWFAGGVFIGAGPWFHGYGHDYYGRGYGYGRGGHYGRGGYGYYGHDGYGRGFDRGYRGGDFHSGNGYRGGGNFRGGGEFHGGGGNFHGGEGHGGGGF